VQPLIRRRPDFLIIGAQKAGTTSLHNYLRRHPSLSPSAGAKELHYFDMYYGRGLSWYLSHFPYRFQRDRALHYESTPDYLVHEVVPARVRRDLGRVKLIAVLREPAERAFSAWRMWHNFADIRPDEAKKADPRSFAQAIEEELASPDGSAGGHFHYVVMGRYAEHLERWRRYFAPQDMLVLNYHEMARDLEGFLRRVSDFLRIAPFPAGVVEELGAQRHWVTPEHPRDEQILTTIERLRGYYRPHNERLFDLIGERWGWHVQ